MSNATRHTTDNRRPGHRRPFLGRLRPLATATLAGIVAAMSVAPNSYAVTDDTEVFFNPYVSVPDKPNVLFIIDNSGSMNEQIGGSGPDRNDTRLQAIKGAMNDLLRNETILKNVNAGLMRFTGATGPDNNNPAAQRQPIYFPVAPLNDAASTIDNGPTTLATPLAAPETVPTVRTRLLNIIEAMNPDGFTPIPGTLLEAARYMLGTTVGFNSITPNGSAFGRFGVSHKASVTGGTFGRCSSFNSSGTCASPNATCTSATNDTSAWCNIITGTATYKSPLIADRGEPFNTPLTAAEKEAVKCRTADYIILLTDGLPTQNNQTVINDAQTLTGTTCQQRVTDATFPNGLGTCAKEIAGYLHNPPNGDLRPSQGNLGPTGKSQQWVITHTIAFALDDQAGQDYLKEISDAGGGNLYLANNRATLVRALEDIFTNIVPKQNAGFAAPKFSTQAFNRLYSGDDVYVSLFVPSNRSRWVGNVKKYRACTDLHPNWTASTKTCNTANGNFAFGTILDRTNNPLVDPATGDIRTGASDLWSLTASDGANVQLGGAGTALANQTPASRNIFTFTGSYDTAASAAPGKVVTHVRSSIDDAAVTAAMFGVADKATIVPWIRARTDVNDEDGDKVVAEPLWPFDDPMHSSALPIEVGTGASTTLKKVFVAGNSGGLRMLNPDTGAEEWFYIPQELLPYQVQLQTNPPFILPGSLRVYGLDGTPTVWLNDQNQNGIVTDSGDFVRLVLGQRDGGRRYFAIDVTPSGSPAAILPELKWVIDPARDPKYADLASAWSRPTLGRLLVGGVVKDVLIFGGGNDTALNDQVGPQLSGSRKGNAVFVADAATGERLALIGGNATTTVTDPVTGATVTTQTSTISGFDFPIPGNITAFDSNGDGFTDRLYYGDLGGNVWRTDLVVSGSTVSGNDTTRRIADLADDNTVVPPALLPLRNADPAAIPEITASNTPGYRAFYFAPEVVRLDNPQYGGRFDLVIISAGHAAHPLDLTVQNAIYAIKDKNLSPYTASTTVTPVTGACASTLTATSTATNCLADITTNQLQRDNTGNFVNAATVTDPAKANLQYGAGWVIYMADTVTAPNGVTSLNWRGEKAYSQPIVIGGKLFYTTFIPPTVAAMRNAALPGQCGIANGAGRIYARDLLTGAAVFRNWNDKDTSTNPDSTLSAQDTFRETGGLPPSEIGVGVRPDDIIVAAQSPLKGSPTGTGLPRRRIYWQER